MEDYNNKGYIATFRAPYLFGVPGIDYNKFFTDKPESKDKPDLSNIALIAFSNANKKKDRNK